MKKELIILFFVLNCLILQAQTLPGFKAAGTFDEQQMLIENSPPSTRTLINAPLKGFGKNHRVLLVFYALPNGNSIEQSAIAGSCKSDFTLNPFILAPFEILHLQIFPILAIPSHACEMKNPEK